MKTLTVLFIAVLLAGCEEPKNIFGEIGFTAKQTFTNAGGNRIELHEMVDPTHPYAPVTTEAIIERDATGQPTGWISFLTPNCISKWDIKQVTNYDAFWLGNGEVGAPTAWFVVYDANDDQCKKPIVINTYARYCDGISGYMDTVVPTTGIVVADCYPL